MSAQDIADMVMKMTPPLECSDEDAKTRWRLIQAALIAIQETINAFYRNSGKEIEIEIE